MGIINLTKESLYDRIYGAKETYFEDGYVEKIQDIIRSKPFGEGKFYIYSFLKNVPRDEIENFGVSQMDLPLEMDLKILYHQPRMTKPVPTPGTTLISVDTREPDVSTIHWTLPHQEAINKYQEGALYENEFVQECIEKFLNSPNDFLQKESWDKSEDEMKEIYEAKSKKRNV